MGKEHRRLRNYLLSPLIQLKIISHIIVVAAVFLLLALGYSYWAWSDIVALMIQMTDVPQQVQRFLEMRFLTFFCILALILIAQFTVMSLFLILHTHRFVGASFAIKRFIRDKLKVGDFDGAVALRKNDYLFDVSEELNELAVELKKGKR